jgi:NCS2 family nucleobase:cation symporter-2
VGFVLAGVYVLAALIPGLADLAMIIPRPVLGAALLLSACFILTNAMQAIVSQALDNRKILVVSLAFFFGLSQHFYPAIFSDLPGPLRQLLNSELTVGVMVLVLLVPLFRWGTRRGMTTELRLQGDQHLAVAQFIEQAAARLGARTDMMHRAIAATTEFIELAPDLVLDKGAIQLAASFDDFILRIDIRYQGQPLALTRSDADKPDIEAFMNDSDLAPPSLHRLSLLLMTRLCDELKWSHSGQDCQVNLRFR